MTGGSDPLVLLGADVWTGRGERMENAAVVISDGRIVEVTADGQHAPQKGEVVDLAGHTIVPGFQVRTSIPRMVVCVG